MYDRRWCETHSDFLNKQELERKDMLDDPKYRDLPIEIAPMYITGSQDGKEYTHIQIKLNDGTFIHVSPGMSERNWKIVFDPKTHEYHTSRDTWCEMIKPNGVIALWKKGKDI